MQTQKQNQSISDSLPRASYNRAGTIKNAPLPIALKLIAITLFLPEELSFYVFGLRLTVTRAIFLLITPLLLFRAVKMLTAQRVRVVPPDALVMMTGLWMIVGFANVDGLEDSLRHMGPLVLEFCIGYFTMRILLTEHGQALSFVEILCHATAVVALIGLLDPLTNRWFTHELAKELTGYVKIEANGGGEWADAYRWGLLRADGPVEHPILFGVISAFGFLLSMTSPIRARRLTLFACAIGLFASLSSAPIQAAFVGVGLLSYDRMLSGVRTRWWILISSGVVGYAVLKVITNSPVSYIFEHLLFNASSYWSRVWEWQTVGDAVFQSPWFGVANHWTEIALQNDAFTSVDSVWLATALSSGIPAAVLLALSMIAATSSATNGPGVDLTAAESKLATTLSILLFLAAVLGLTVHFWGMTWVLLGILIGVRSHLGALARSSRRRGVTTYPVATASNKLGAARKLGPRSRPI